MAKKIYNNVLELIGQTPIVKLNSVVKDGGAQLFAKLEYFNPGSSLKDRIAVEIIEDAVEKGELEPGGTIVEATSGNTGAGLAIAGAVLGYKTIFVMPDKVSNEKIQLLKALGGEVIITPTSVNADSPESYYSVARKIASETPKAYLSNQYFNQANPRAHYKTTGPEIWDQMGGDLDVFVTGLGTGGTVSGIGEYLKEKNPDIRIIGADPYGSVLKTYKESGILIQSTPYLVEGIGEDIIPGTLQMKFVDEIYNVSDRDSFRMSRRLTREEGIFCGGSSGTIAHVAVNIAAEMKPDEKVLCIIPDTGDRYLSKHHSDEWMREKRLLDSERITVRMMYETKPQTIPKLVSVSKENYVKDALKLMNEYNFSQLPVINDNESIGSVREGILLGMVLEDSESVNTLINEIMDDPFPVIDENSNIDSASQTLKNAPAAIVRDRDNLVGIITRFDVLEFIAPME